jgi:hypothetical protein
MNPNDIPQAGWMFQLLAETAQWLRVIVYLIGLGIAIWAFHRSRKCGYLIFAIYFALTALWLIVAVPVWRAIHAHDPPDTYEQTRQQIDETQRVPTDSVPTETGHPMIPDRRRVYFPFGPILLVVGVWLLATRETPVAKP